MLIAITVDDEQVEALDRLVPDQFRSRSEIVRTAIAAWLAERAAASSIDRRYREAYIASPPSHDEVDGGRLRAGHPAPAGWEELDG